MLKRYLCFGIIFILLINSVYAIGISPGKAVVYFEPNKVQEVEFYVVNRDSDIVDAQISLSDVFSEGMSLPGDTIFSLNPGEKRYFNVVFDMPAEVNIPGDYITKVTASELAPSGAFGSATVGSTVAVISQLIFRVPHEGYYLGGSLSAESVSVGELAKFNINLENLGDREIPNFDGIIKIYNSKNETVDTITFASSLALHEIQKMELVWDTSGQVADEYIAKMTINYMSKSFEAGDNFKLGDIFVKILDYQKEVGSGIIGDYVYTLESGWSNEIQDVFVKLVIEYNGQGYIYKSENFNLMPWETKEDKMYIDARELPEGVYPATFGVHYEGISNTESFDIKVAKKINYLLYGGISLLVLIILALLIFIFRIMRSRDRRLNKK